MTRIVNTIAFCIIFGGLAALLPTLAQDSGNAGNAETEKALPEPRRLTAFDLQRIDPDNWSPDLGPGITGPLQIPDSVTFPYNRPDALTGMIAANLSNATFSTNPEGGYALAEALSRQFDLIIYQGLRGTPTNEIFAGNVPQGLGGEFSRDCDAPPCSIATWLGTAESILIPGNSMFAEHDANQFEVVSSAVDDELYRTTGVHFGWASKYDPTGYDAYWGKAARLWQTAASYVCEYDEEYRVLYADMEIYSRDDPAPTFWTEPIYGLGEEETIRAVYQRGQQIGRAIKQGCPTGGVTAMFYKPADKGIFRSLRAAWLAGIAQSGAVSQVHFTAFSYNKTNNEPLLPGLLGELRNDIEADINGVAEREISGEPNHDTARNLLSKLKIVPVLTVAQERRARSGDDDDQNQFTYLTHRAKNQSKGAITYFELDPFFQSKQVELLKHKSDRVFVYPGVRDYACYINSPWCDGQEVYEKIWSPFAETAFDASLIMTEQTAINRVLRFSDTLRQWKIAPRPVDWPTDELDPFFLTINAPSWWERANFPAGHKYWLMSDVQLDQFNEGWARRKITVSRRIFERSVGKFAVPQHGFFSRKVRLSVVETDGTSGSESGDIALALPGADFVRGRIAAGEVRYDDHFLEVLVYIDRENNFDTLLYEGVPVDLPSERGYHWVRLARRYSGSYRPVVKFATPPAPHRTRIAGIRTVAVSKTVSGEAERLIRTCYGDDSVDETIRMDLTTFAAEKEELWQGLEMQDNVTGDGWKRTSDGAISFDPHRLSRNGFLYSTQSIALPGRRSLRPSCPLIPSTVNQDSLKTFASCIYVVPTGNTPAKFRTSFPSTPARNELIQNAREAGWLWVPSSGGYRTSLAEQPSSTIQSSHQFMVNPEPDTGPFAIHAVTNLRYNSGSVPLEDHQRACLQLPEPSIR